MKIATIYFDDDAEAEDAFLELVKDHLKADLVLSFSNVNKLPGIQYPYITVEKFDV